MVLSSRGVRVENGKMYPDVVKQRVLERCGSPLVYEMLPLSKSLLKLYRRKLRKQQKKAGKSLDK